MLIDSKQDACMEIESCISEKITTDSAVCNPGISSGERST